MRSMMYALLQLICTFLPVSSKTLPISLSHPPYIKMRYSNVIVSSLCGLLGLTPVVSFHSSTQALIHRKHSNELVHRVGFLSGKITYATSPSGNNDADQSLRDGVKLTSGKKVIEYDSASGRFFETNEGECVPEDEYCAIDDKTGQKIRLTVQEKERIFLDALQAYYFSGRKVLNDSDFDLLKEDLSWNGSPVVQLNRKEATYLAAVQAYLKGEPIMSNADFDSLKAELKEEKSRFAVSTEPKCYIDTGICTVTLKDDFFRTNLLYLPALALLSIAWLGLGFEIIEPIIRINPIFILILGAPLIINGTKWLTDNYIFKDNKIVYGPCPACEAENRVYFGDILGVEGFSDVASVKCPNCKVDFNVQRKTLRASTLPK